MNDFLKFQIEEYKVKVIGGKIAAFRAKEITRTGARKFFDGKISSASVIGETTNDNLLKKCDEFAAVALPADAVPKGSEKKSWNFCGSKNLADEAQAAADKQITRIKQELPNFTVQGQVLSQRNTVNYWNSLGTQLELKFDDFAATYEFRRKGSPNILDSYFVENNTSGLNNSEGLDWTIELLQTYDNEVTIKPGRNKMLLQADYSVMNKIGESLRADLYKEGTALYSGKSGEKLFSDKLNICDLRNVPDRASFSPFDYEGSVAKEDKTTLIKNGVLTSVISDLKNEKIHGEKSTANGFRQYNSSVKLGFSNLTIEPGRRSFKEILRDAGDVIVSVMAFGGDLTAQGGYSTPVQLSFLVKNGRVVGRLPAISMNSHIRQMLGTELLEVASNGPFQQSNNPYHLSEVDVQVV